MQKVFVASTVTALSGITIYTGYQAPRFRDEVERLRTREVPLREQIGQLQQERDAATGRVAQAGDPRFNAPDQAEELLRLRGEAGRSRRQLLEFNQQAGRVPADSEPDVARAAFERVYRREVLPLAVPQGAKPPPDVPAKAIFPKTAWSFAGFATPEATLQAIEWAALHGDLDTLKRCHASTEDQAQFEQATFGQFPGKNQSETATEIAACANQTEGYRILQRTTYANGQVGILFYEDGPGNYRTIRLQQVGDEWKIAPGPRGGQP
jgi:hypothetical protein